MRDGPSRSTFCSALAAKAACSSWPSSLTRAPSSACSATSASRPTRPRENRPEDRPTGRAEWLYWLPAQTPPHRGSRKFMTVSKATARAHSLARLRIAGRVTAAVARLATGWAG